MIVVFTDLDGTLLDCGTQSLDAALPAIERLERLSIPIVFCTSKTRLEVEPIRRSIGNAHPFIVENGGAAFVPRGYFPGRWSADRRIDGCYDLVEFGAPYADLTAALRAAARESSCPVRGFHSLSAEEVAACCGLTLDEARRAKQREYDEPFQIRRRVRAGVLLGAIERLGYRWTRGDAWYHLTGNNDKALAAQALLARFRDAYGTMVSVGLGDSPNDAALLSMTDIAFIVRSPLAAAVQALVPGAHVTTQCGAAGWNEAVPRFLALAGVNECFGTEGR